MFVPRSGNHESENAGLRGRGEKMGTAHSVHASQKALLGTEWAVPIFSRGALFSRPMTTFRRLVWRRFGRCARLGRR